MPRPKFIGAFSYKYCAQDDLTKHHFIIINQETAAKFQCTDPGHGTVSFHPINPYDALGGVGCNDMRPEYRVNEAQNLGTPPEDVFRVLLSDTEVDGGPIPPLQPVDDMHVYEIVWIFDYLFIVNNARRLKLILQQQGAELEFVY
ncbi:hypothetical protein EW145_g3005 [Phellinidium pouzarii]|uniref:Uncharacterized protein n=1 Tax=Phellinidium pouzarii TaxID=167371 RepID=A0A4V3XD15_9AGAM|nr:hypothetical protein EW145_g3005 [Phellinidium pouzarii]